MNTRVQYNFEWDPNKANENLQKHKVRFERATEIFQDHLSVSIFDREHSESEERWITLGQDYSGVLLVVVHTFEEEGDNQFSIRIISIRKATKREMRQYKGQSL